MTRKVQLINEEHNYNADLLRVIEEDWKVADKGFDYNTVAVFGSQSTGKSTLLNSVFSTDFDVMTEKCRKQTTRGFFLS